MVNELTTQKSASDLLVQAAEELGGGNLGKIQFGRIENPDFPIVGWTGGTGMAPAAPAAPAPAQTLPAKAVHPAFDDQIPW